MLKALARFGLAEKVLMELVAAAPENVAARNVLALAAVRRGDFAEGERQYEGSLRYQPRQHRVLVALGAIALHRGDVEEAERRFHDALDLAPTYVEAMSNLGFVAMVRGDATGAQGWYERAIAVDPSYPHVYRRLGKLEDSRKALDAFTRLEKETHDLEEMRRNLANSSATPPQPKSQRE